jgi:hypothetical protein
MPLVMLEGEWSHNTSQRSDEVAHEASQAFVALYLNGTRPMGITYGRSSQDNADDIKVFSD